MCYVVSVVEERELFSKAAHVDATTPRYFAAHISIIEKELRTPLSLVPDCAFSILLRIIWCAEILTTVTALRDSSLLLDVKVSESAAGCLDDADLVALGRVTGARAVGEA